jgi:hypothetical protein
MPRATSSASVTPSHHPNPGSSPPNTSRVIDEAMDTCLAAHHSVTIAAKQVRLGLLKEEG